ncbi:MAG: 50S ribosomal protein L11 methyltransferase [Saprospiraceae bacterium]|nr:50S ribosomal protein L11 methyltransferase [Saprospiraceae bacterium]
MNYLKLTIQAPEDISNDIIIAHLSDFQFNGFIEEEELLIAYIAEKNFCDQSKTKFESLIVKYNLKIEKQLIVNQNWNKKWESDYEPVFVDEFCAVRATFHKPILKVKHEIVVTPKMSFGTGHHATTYMMIKQMEKLKFNQKSVLDYGCGTGVLAILAHKLGALKLTAIDIDKWAYENTLENIDINNSSNAIHVYCGKIEAAPFQKYDFILANINRNVILNTMEEMSMRLIKGGYLLASGFLNSDVELIIAAANKHGLSVNLKTQKDKWNCLLFS